MLGSRGRGEASVEEGLERLRASSWAVGVPMTPWLVSLPMALEGVPIAPKSALLRLFLGGVPMGP